MRNTLLPLPVLLNGRIAYMQIVFPSLEQNDLHISLLHPGRSCSTRLIHLLH